MTANWLCDAVARGLVDEALAGAHGDRPTLDGVRSAATAHLAGAELAGVLVVCDLVAAGWSVQAHRGSIALDPPAATVAREAERRRIRAQLGVERDRQLGTPAVRGFLRRMESPRHHRGRFASIYALMCDGRELAGRLQRGGAIAVSPYVQLAIPGVACERTGLDLGEVWRYFRHTWQTPYRSAPGRGLMFLIRDAAADTHPVIGISMLGSAPSQIAARDQWIGWEAEDVLRECAGGSNVERATWLSRALEGEIEGVWTADLLADETFSPADLRSADDAAVEGLREEARQRRVEHERFGDGDLLRAVPEADDEDAWRARASSPLFRSKRAELLARLIAARHVVADALSIGPEAGLHALARSEDGRRAVRLASRRWKASRMGVAIADLHVCGAISPYREILGGKLVAMLMTSRDAVGAFEARYADSPSVIASSVAGRPVIRDSRLALLTTTSLYGRGSQYSRLRGGGGAGSPYLEVGFTEGFGSAHLSDVATEALSTVVSRASGGRKLYSLFGEGVSPKLRKVRDGLEILGLDSEAILRHGAKRAVYVAPLALNVRRYLCGLDDEMERHDLPDAGSVVEAWRERWSAGRIGRPGVLDAVCAHTLERPVRHGARVARPDAEAG